MIPKGEVEEHEDALTAARREVEEETGARPSGAFIPLAPVHQTGGKIVHVWAVESEFDPASLTSNLFEMEWPPKSGRLIRVPEIDRVIWVGPAEAHRRLNPAQAGFVDRLLQALART